MSGSRAGSASSSSSSVAASRSLPAAVGEQFGVEVGEVVGVVAEAHPAKRRPSTPTTRAVGQVADAETHQRADDQAYLPSSPARSAAFAEPQRAERVDHDR